jgi:hypothetical protein
VLITCVPGVADEVEDFTTTLAESDEVAPVFLKILLDDVAGRARLSASVLRADTSESRRVKVVRVELRELLLLLTLDNWVFSFDKRLLTTELKFDEFKSEPRETLPIISHPIEIVNCKPFML